MTGADRDLERMRVPPRAKLSEKDLQIKQSPFRMHKNDWPPLRALLKSDGWPLQKVFEAVVAAYMRRDPLLIKILADWREDQQLPSQGKRLDKYTLSPSERRDLMKELEAESPL